MAAVGRSICSRVTRARREMNVSTLLEDLLSRDPTRIWAASSAVVRLRDPQELDRLAQSVAEIRRETRGVALGGSLYPNAERLRFVLHKLEYHRGRSGCLCRLYPEYLMYDPREEAAAGNVRIEDTIYLEGQRVDAYGCACTVCEARYRVEEREYHYIWWGWTALA